MVAKLSAGIRWSLLMVMVIVSALFMLNASKGDSAIVDELPNITAGYSYVRYLDYRLNPEHPPLVKILSGLPLLLQSANWRINFPISSLAWQQEVNGQSAIGTEFLYESGNDADKIINTARLGPILLTLLLIIAVYLFSKELMGRWWSLLPTFLIALSPAVLAHGHYVTTSIGATLGILIATWAFLNFLFSPSRKRLLTAGLAFGFTQLTEFSALLLIPYFLILIAIFFAVSVIRDWSMTDPVRGHLHRFAIRGFRYLRSVLLIFLIGFAVVLIFYFLFTLNYPIEKQVSDTEFILSNFSPRWLADFTIWLAGIPALRAIAHYLLGLLMVFERSAEGNIGYANILTFLWKEPPGSLILILIAFIFSIWGIIKAAPAVIFRKSNQFMDYLNTHFAELSMILFVIIYCPFGIIPTLPFIYILTAGAIKRWLSLKNLETAQHFVIKVMVLYQELLSVSVKSAILGVLLIWYFISPVAVAPHFLSYFNIFSGGTKNGYRLAVGSNYDWGQDLKRLKIWVDKNLPEEEKIAVDYFGGGNPKYYLGELAETWWSARGNPNLEGIKWLAVSINNIQIPKKPEDEYQWLAEPYKPYARAGTSIFIYKLD